MKPVQIYEHCRVDYDAEGIKERALSHLERLDNGYVAAGKDASKNNMNI
jgi:hypothetical protein